MRRNARIYVMEAANGDLKVGVSNNPVRRRKEIGPVKIVHMTDVKAHAEQIERTAHRLLALSRRHIRDEWFKAALGEAIDAIERAERIVDGLELPLDRPMPKAQYKLVIDFEDSNALAEFWRTIDDIRTAARPVKTIKQAIRDAIINEARRLRNDARSRKEDR